MSCDVTDIGKFSMTPATMVTNLGYSQNLFSDNLSKIKPAIDLNDLPNIETQDISVDVIPFWGDKDNFEIGFTQVNFRIKAKLITTFTIFGSVFTDGENDMWTKDNNTHELLGRKPYELYVAKNGNDTASLKNKRIGIVSETIYYYPPQISDEDIDNDNVDPQTDMLILDSSEYSIFKKDGDFILVVPCNRKKIITKEDGTELNVSYDYQGGVFTEFKGFMVIEYENKFVKLNINDKLGKKVYAKGIRLKLKIPQKASIGKSFNKDDDLYSNNWRKQHYTFEYNQYYSIAKFNSTVWSDTERDNYYDENNKYNSDTGLFSFEKINTGNMNDYYITRNVGIIKTNVNTDVDTIYDDFPSNIDRSSDYDLLFGGNWLNFSIYLPQIGYVYTGARFLRDVKSNTTITPNIYSDFIYNVNSQIIAANNPNTQYMARSDLHFTNFIKVSKSDLIALSNYNKKGFTEDELNSEGITLESQFMNGANLTDVPNNGTSRIGGSGLINANPNNSVDTNTYFYKGLNDCIKFLNDMKLL
jgi:hypothetical protein